LLLFWFGFIVGAILGSFSNAMIYRIPLGISIWRSQSKEFERSVCPHCNHTLFWGDLVPLLSWLVLRGRGRYCHTPIGVRYILVEIMSAILCGAVLFVGGVALLSGVGVVLVPIFVTGSVVFFRYRQISMLKSLCFVALSVFAVAGIIFLLLP